MTKEHEKKVERPCVVCEKPVFVRKSTLKSKGGNFPWKHQACYIQSRKFTNYDFFEEPTW